MFAAPVIYSQPVYAQTVPGGSQSTQTKTKSQAAPGGIKSGPNGSETGVTSGAATIGSADTVNTGKAKPNPPPTSGAGTMSGAYNGSQTGVTDGVGTVGMANDAPSQSSASGANTTVERRPVRDHAANSVSANGTLPNTAADWLAMLLCGTMLSGAGLVLRHCKPQARPCRCPAVLPHSENYGS